MDFDPGGFDMGPGDFDPGGFDAGPGDFDSGFDSAPVFDDIPVEDPGMQEMDVLDDVPAVPDIPSDINDFESPVEIPDNEPSWDTEIPAIEPPPSDTAIPTQPDVFEEPADFQPDSLPPAIVVPEITDQSDSDVEPDLTDQPDSTVVPEITDQPEPGDEPVLTDQPGLYDAPDFPESNSSDAVPENIGPSNPDEPGEESVNDQGEGEPGFIGPEQTEIYHSPETTDEIEPGVGPNPSWDQTPTTITDDTSAEDEQPQSIEVEDVEPAQVEQENVESEENLFEKDAEESDTGQEIEEDSDQEFIPEMPDSSSEENGDDVADEPAETTDEETADIEDNTPENIENPENQVETGTFDIDDWTDYPDGPKPEGSFRILDGDEYEEARKDANKANRELHDQHPEWEGMDIHEIHPVKFGGDPTDPANKIILTPEQHNAYTNWWKNFQRNMN